MELDEKVKAKAVAKINEVKSMIGEMPIEEFISEYCGDSDDGEEMGEKEMPMGGSKDPAKIALIVARLKKKA